MAIPIHTNEARNAEKGNTRRDVAAGATADESTSTASTEVSSNPHSLGQREREVMSIMCQQGSASVKQVSDRLSAALAYTTVMTTLDRLFKKGFLGRRKQDRAYIYSAVLTSREVEDQRASRLVDHFFSGSGEHPEILVSSLVDAVHRYDTKLLEQLEAKIRSARKDHDLARSNRGGS